MRNLSKSPDNLAVRRASTGNFVRETSRLIKMLPKDKVCSLGWGFISNYNVTSFLPPPCNYCWWMLCCLLYHGSQKIEKTESGSSSPWTQKVGNYTSKSWVCKACEKEVTVTVPECDSWVGPGTWSYACRRCPPAQSWWVVDWSCQWLPQQPTGTPSWLHCADCWL